MAAVYDPSHPPPDADAPPPAPATKPPSREEALAIVAEASRLATKALGEPVGMPPVAAPVPWVLQSPNPAARETATSVLGQPLAPPPPVEAPAAATAKSNGNGAAAEPVGDTAVFSGGRVFSRPAGWFKEQDRLLAEKMAAMDEAEKKALADAGGKKRVSGWDVGAPSTEKLARLLDLASSTQPLCATCRYAVQMVVPFVDMDGLRDLHETKTFCSVIRVDGAKNLELSDEPVHYCSHRAFSPKAWLERKWIGWKARSAPGRIVKALRVLQGASNG